VALYEIFKRVLDVKGSVVECGVNEGFGVMTWAKLSAILEPVNLTRRIYGFDTFAGFPGVSEQDRSDTSSHVAAGDLFADSYDEIMELAEIHDSTIHDSTRFLGHIPKVELIRGDAVETIPAFVEENPHVVVSLLFLDFDLYEPTRAALEPPSTNSTTRSGRARRSPCSRCSSSTNCVSNACRSIPISASRRSADDHGGQA
jgi:hypothetical protein